MLWVDLARAGLQRLQRVQRGRQHLVGDVHQLGGGARRLAVDRGHRGQHVAHVACLFALGDETGPVVVEHAVPALARNVRSGGNNLHARQRASP